MERWKKLLVAAVMGIIAAVPAMALDAGEIVQLVRSGVQDTVIINMVRNNKLPAPLTMNDILTLNAGGASQQLLQFLTSPDASYAAAPQYSATPQYAAAPSGTVVSQPYAVDGGCATGSCGDEVVVGQPRVISSTVVGTSEYPATAVQQGTVYAGSGTYYGGDVYSGSEVYYDGSGTTGYYADGGYYTSYPSTSYPVTTYPSTTTYYVDDGYYETYPYSSSYYYDYSYPSYYGGSYYSGHDRYRPRPPSSYRPGGRPGKPGSGGRPGSYRPPSGKPSPGIRPPSGGSSPAPRPPAPRPPSGELKPPRPKPDGGTSGRPPPPPSSRSSRR